MKRVLAVLLSVVLLLALLPAGMVAASSRPLTLKELQKMYPHGAYWNHTGTANNPLGYTWTPCYHHGGCTYSGSCGCNSYEGKAIQCMGFAYQLASLAYDCDPRSEWDTNYSTAALNKLKAGDIVRYRNSSHSIFITAVDGDNVTYVDGNWDNHCQIQWGKTITKATLKSSFTYVKAAPYALDELHAPDSDEHRLTIRYHAGGGTISDAVEAHQYMVTDPDGVNMRAGAGTGNAILTALPIGTVFSVKVGDTKTAGGYTWGKTTVNNITGWVVISDFVTKTTDLSGEDYYLIDSVVYSVDTAAPVTQTATVGETVKLSNPATFYLTNGKRPFLGWTADPKVAEPLYSWDVTTLKAEVLCPELLEQDVTLTLYAVWGCAHEYESACAEKCRICGELRGVTTHKFKDGICTVCGKEESALVITAQPQTGYAPMGEKATVTVEASGDGLTYQWYVRNAGATKFAKSSITSATYAATLTEKSKDREVRCTVTDQYGHTVESQVALLREAVSLTAQPQSGYAPMGEKVTVAVEASGDGLTYQWYIRNAGATKFAKSSITSATYAATLTEKSKDREVRCTVTDQYGHTVESQVALLREQVSLTAQPQIGYAPMGGVVMAAVEASGDGLTYQWYVKNEGATKYAKSSVTSATYSAVMSDKSKNRRVLCYVYDRYGNRVQSQSVVLRERVSILTEPNDSSAQRGEKVATTVKAGGDGLKYQWYVKNEGATKYTKSSITSATYSATMSDKSNNRQVYCVVTDRWGNVVQTEAVILTIK